MRFLIAFVLPLAIVSACDSSPERSRWEARLDEANNVLLNEGHVERVSEYFSPTYVAHVPGGDRHGQEAVADFVTELRQAFPDLEVRIEVLVTEGNRVAWLRRSGGTHQGEILGVPPSGQPVIWQDMIVTRFEEGMIAEEWGVSGLAGSLLAQ